MLAPFVLLLVAAGACPTRLGPAPLTTAEAEARADAIASLIAAEHAAHQRWQVAWAAGMGAAMVGQTGWADLSPDEGRRAVLVVGVAKATVALVSVLTYSYAAPALAPIEAADACRELAAAEAALLALADDQAAATAWWRQGGGALLNVAGALFVGFAYGEWLWGTIAAVIGLAVGQAILRSAPTGAAEAVQQLRDGAPLGRRDARVLDRLSLTPLGVGFAWAF